MGKNKGFNLFETYLNTTENVQDSIPLPDSMRTSTLIEQIGKEYNWSEHQINKDIDILEDNRLYYIRELRELSSESWQIIPLLPLVKDLLRKALDPKRIGLYSLNNKKEDRNERKIRKKEEKRKKKEERREEKSSSSSSSSSSPEEEEEGREEVETEKKPKVFNGRPIKPVSHNRIRVQTTDGTVYECDRLCPHKKVDLATWGQVVGHSLICTKHNWRFDLNNNSSTKGRSVYPCKVNEW